MVFSGRICNAKEFHWVNVKECMHAEGQGVFDENGNGREGSTDDDMSMPIPPFSHIEERNAGFDLLCAWQLRGKFLVMAM